MLTFIWHSHKGKCSSVHFCVLSLVSRMSQIMLGLCTPVRVGFPVGHSVTQFSPLLHGSTNTHYASKREETASFENSHLRGTN